MNHPVSNTRSASLPNLGLQTQQLNAALVQERLAFLHDHRDIHGNLKAGNNPYNWFRKTNRPLRSYHLLGRHKFAHVELPTFSYIPTNPAYLFEPTVQKDINKDGSVIVKDIFTWWWDAKIQLHRKDSCTADIISVEFDMYRCRL